MLCQICIIDSLFTTQMVFSEKDATLYMNKRKHSTLTNNDAGLLTCSKCSQISHQIIKYVPLVYMYSDQRFKLHAINGSQLL